MTSKSETAKIIRKVLKAQFPETKFSVKVRNFSIYVSWNAGPRNTEVMPHIGGYQYKENKEYANDYIICNNYDAIPHGLTVIG